MPNSVMPAMRVSQDFFNLDHKAFNGMLADGVRVKVRATIGPDQRIKKELTGKDAVIAFFAARHFDITTHLSVEKLRLKPTEDGKVKVRFTTLETKTEGDSSVDYRYKGRYTLKFDDKGQVAGIHLKNSRETLPQKT